MNAFDRVIGEAEVERVDERLAVGRSTDGVGEAGRSRRDEAAVGVGDLDREHVASAGLGFDLGDESTVLADGQGGARPGRGPFGEPQFPAGEIGHFLGEQAAPDGRLAAAALRVVFEVDGEDAGFGHGALAGDLLGARENGGAAGDDGHRVDAMVDADRQALLQPLTEVAGLGRAADEDDAIHRGARHALFLEHAQGDVDRLVDERGRGGEEFLAGQLDIGAVDHRAVAGVDIGAIERRGVRVGEHDLGGFGRGLELLHAHAGLFFAVRAVEPVGEVRILGMHLRQDDLLDEGPVDVRAAEEVVAAVVDDGDGAVFGLDERGIERAAAEVEDQPVGLFAGGLEAVGEGGGDRLLEKGDLSEAGQLGGLHGGGRLVGLERGRHGDHGGEGFFAEGALHVAAEGFEDLGGKLFGQLRHAGGLEREGLLGAHHALELDLGVRAAALLQLVLGALADDQLLALVDADGRRGDVIVQKVLDDLGGHAVQHGDRAVGGAEVDAEIERLSWLAHGVL